MSRLVEVRVGSILHGYTGGQGELRESGETLGDLLVNLDRRFPGLWHRAVDEQGRLRPHLAVFLDKRSERSLAAPLATVQRVHLLGAISGG